MHYKLILSGLLVSISLLLPVKAMEVEEEKALGDICHVQLHKEPENKERFENIVKSANSFFHADMSSWQSHWAELEFFYNNYQNQEPGCQGVRVATEERILTLLGDMLQKDSDIVRKALEKYKGPYRSINPSESSDLGTVFELISELDALCWWNFSYPRLIQERGIDELEDSSISDLSGSSYESDP